MGHPPPASEEVAALVEGLLLPAAPPRAEAMAAVMISAERNNLVDAGAVKLARILREAHSTHQTGVL